MKKCIFVSCKKLDGYVFDDDLAFSEFARRGWSVQWVPWESPIEQFLGADAAIVRTPWNYTENRENFLNKMQQIEDLAIPLFNPSRVMNENSDKIYLKSLAKKGIPIVPTLFLDDLSEVVLHDFFSRYSTKKAVIKPRVGASAIDTFVLHVANIAEDTKRLSCLFEQRPFMLQPFIESVISTGELSFIFMNDQLSHVIRKVPKSGDFRVQEEYGGEITLVRPAEGDLAQARDVVEAIGESLLFARVDMVRGDDGSLSLMELELTEPSLYLRMDPAAPERLAEAFVQRAGRLT